MTCSSMLYLLCNYTLLYVCFIYSGWRERANQSKSDFCYLLVVSRLHCTLECSVMVWKFNMPFEPPNLFLSLIFNTTVFFCSRPVTQDCFLPFSLLPTAILRLIKSISHFDHFRHDWWEIHVIAPPFPLPVFYTQRTHSYFK